jgi:hypothetical protein
VSQGSNSQYSGFPEYDVAMRATQVVIDGKSYVILSKRRYEQLTRHEQDRLDADTARKVVRRIDTGKEKTLPWEQAKRRLGL